MSRAPLDSGGPVQCLPWRLLATLRAVSGRSTVMLVAGTDNPSLTHPGTHAAHSEYDWTMCPGFWPRPGASYGRFAVDGSRYQALDVLVHRGCCGRPGCVRPR